MKEKAFLIVYFFRIPFSFRLAQTDNSYGDAIKIQNVDLESHIEYISEQGNVVSKTSRAGTKIADVWISNNKDTPRQNYFYTLFDYPSNGKHLNIGSALASKIGAIHLAAHMEGNDPHDFRIKRDTPTTQIVLPEPENPKVTYTIESVGNGSEAPPHAMYFDVSNISFNLIKMLLKGSSSAKIVMNYSEIQNTSFLILLFFHMPVILVSVAVVLLVIMFEPGISKDAIQDEISRLPLQKYTENIGFSECPICLDTFQINEDVRVLSCKHCFHKNCIDSWLRSMLKCPICRNSVTRLADSENYTFYQALNTTP